MLSSQSPFQNNHLLLETAREMGIPLNAFWHLVSVKYVISYILGCLSFIH